MKNLFLLLFLASSVSLFAQTPCSLDNTWDSDGKLVSDGSRLGDHLLVQSDGKVLVACNPFGNSHVYLKRFNVDGSVDMTYGTSGKFTVQVMERRTSITGMTEFDGVIYICGNTTTDVGGTNTFVYAAAINPNGGYKTSFGISGVKKFNSSPDLYTSSAIHVEAPGHIYMTGLEGLKNLFVLRMSLTGVMDNTFDNDGILYQATGNNDHWYETNSVKVDGNGKVLITGKKYKANNGSTITPFWNLMVMRFNSNGSLDNTFAGTGIGLYNSSASNFDEGQKIHITPNNEYIVCGNTYDGNDYDYNTLKLKNTGAPDLSFGVAGWVLSDLHYLNDTEYSLNSALLQDGRILITGNQGDGDTVYFSLLMLTSNGDRDTVFAPGGVFQNIFNQNNNSSSSGMDLDANGKIVMAGYTRTCKNGTCGPLYMAVSRYNNSFMATTYVAPTIDARLTVYPNPSDGDITVQVESSSSKKGEIILYNSLGRVLLQTSLDPNGKTHIRTDGLSKGIYLAEIIVGEERHARKLVVR